MSATAQAMSRLVPGGVRAGDVRLGDRRLAFVEAGRGPMTVVLEAGRNDSAITWTPVIAHLAPEVRVLAYDRAGLGGSDPAPPGPVVERQLSDLAALLRGCCDGPSVLVGHSWGGRLVQLLARRERALVCGLVLVDPGHEGLAGAAGGARRVHHALVDTPRALLRALGVSRLLDRHRSKQAVGAFTTDEGIRAVLADAYLRRAPNGDELGGLPLGARVTDDGDSGKPLPDVPTIVLSASRGLPPRTRAAWTECQRRLAAESAQGRHLVVRDCGHAIHHERPAAVADAVLEVVGKVDALR